MVQLWAPLGLAAWIHNKTSPPYVDLDKNPIIISPGVFNNIAVERTFESKLGEPYNECLKNVSDFKRNKTIIDYFLNLNQPYSQENRFELCLELFYIQENPCKCSEARLGSVYTNGCIKKTPSLDAVCLLEYAVKFRDNALVEKCSDYCPLECESAWISHTVSAYKFESGFWMLEEQSMMRVFNKSLKHTSIRQQAKTKPEQLISNLGGYLF